MTILIYSKIDFSSYRINDYIESILFCILEELAYVVIESSISFLYHCGYQLPFTLNQGVRAVNSVESVEAIITGISDDPANFLSITIHKNSNYTPYKWNECVVLISPVALSTNASRSALPSLYFGILSNSMDSTNKEEWNLFANISKETKEVLFSLNNHIYLYSMSSFTSYLR